MVYILLSTPQTLNICKIRLFTYLQNQTTQEHENNFTLFAFWFSKTKTRKIMKISFVKIYIFVLFAKFYGFIIVGNWNSTQKLLIKLKRHCSNVYSIYLFKFFCFSVVFFCENHKINFHFISNRKQNNNNWNIQIFFLLMIIIYDNCLLTLLTYRYKLFN